jgi:ABC-type nitrate/sulfonate/bicarbonate transport system substrate-binding protein
MTIGRKIVSSIAAVGVTAGLVGAAQAEPLRIFYAIWLGYGPLFVAQEKGFFAREGVAVELINKRSTPPPSADCSVARSTRWRVPCWMRRHSPSRMNQSCARW